MKLGTIVRIEKAADAEKEFQKLHSLGFSACQLVYKPAEYKKEDAYVIKKPQKNTALIFPRSFAVTMIMTPFGIIITAI